MKYIPRMRLSRTQLGMWFEQRIDPLSAELNIGFAVELSGIPAAEIEIALRHALRRIVGRGLKLREEEGQPRFQECAAIEIEFFDATQPGADEIAREFLSRPFDLATDPLIRVKWGRSSPNGGVSIICAHHIVSDFHSMALLFNAIVDDCGKELPLCEEGLIQVAPAEIEDRFFESDSYSKARSHVEKTLAGFSGRIRLPADDRQRDQSGSRKIGFELGAALRSELESASVRMDCSISHLLSCLTHIHLHAISGQERLILGVPASIRRKDQKSFGCFINTIPIPGAITSADTFASRLHSGKRAARGALRYRAYPWPALVQDLRSQGRSDLALDAFYNFYDFSIFANPDVAMVYFGRARELRFGGLKVRPIQVKVGEAGARISFTFCHIRGRIFGEIQAEASLFGPDSHEQLRTQFERLSLSLLGSPDERIINVLAGRMRGDKVMNVTNLFRRSLVTSHVRIGADKTSFRRLFHAAQGCAKDLADRGIRAETPVIVDLPRSEEWLLSILAIWRIGAIYTPVWNRLPDAQKLDRARAVGAKHIITSERCWSKSEFRLVDPSDWDRASWAASRRESAAPNALLAYYFATSGSTGVPKVLGVSHDGLMRFARSARKAYGITMADRLLVFHRPDRDGSIEELVLSLATGADLVLNPDAEVYSVVEFLRFVEQTGITVLDLPTSYFHELVSGMVENNLRLPIRVRLVIVGGEELTRADLDGWKKTSRIHSRLMNSYGLTETTIVNTVWKYRRLSRAPIAIGEALENSKLVLVDEEGSQFPPSPGKVGELYIGGPCVASYFGPSVEFSRFRLSPIDDAGLLYRTYDLVRCTGKGTLQFLQRLDGMTKVAGDLVSAKEAIPRRQSGRDKLARKPKDQAGKRLFNIYAEVLGHEEIGDEKTFFDLGGSSLLAVRLLARIQAEFRTNIPYAQFLGASSIAEMSRFIGVRNEHYETMQRASHLVEPLMRMAILTPKKVAIVCGDTELTYADLWRRLHQIASNLGGVRQELIPVKAASRLDEVLACMGIARSSRAYVSIDRKSPPERFAAFIERHRLSFAVSDLDLPHVECARPAKLMSGASKPDWKLGPAILAYACMTSGSSGVPKAVLMRHDRALNTLRDVCPRFQIGPTDVAIAMSPMSFDLSVFDVFGVLGVGGMLIVPDGDSPDDWLRALKRHQITVWNSTPGHMQMLLDLFEDQAGDVLGALRLAMFSGDFLSPRLVARIRSLFPDLRIISLGGATEAGIWSNYHEVGHGDYEFIPYGRALDGQMMEVLDGSGRICEPGEKGEIVISGGSLADGYFGEPDLTAGAFRSHPKRGERAYFTGDEGYTMENGEIAIVGRLNREIKVRGYRVSLAEIENVARGYNRLRDCSVQVERKDGINDLVLFAAFGKQGSADELRTKLSSSLPEYMVPRSILGVDSIPRGSTGKVDTEALREKKMIENAAVPVQRAESDLLTTIMDVFQQKLGVDSVGESDDFFSMGGNSLSAASTLSAIKARTGVILPLMAFSRNPTPAAIVRLIEEGAITDHSTHRSVAELERMANEHLVHAEYKRPRRKLLRKTLITGATGSIGTALLPVLGREKRTEFIILGRNAPAKLYSNMRWIRGDLEKERFGLTNTVFDELCEVDSIIHLAAKVNFASSLNALLPSNVSGTRRIVELAGTGSGKTLHYFSTAGVFPYGTNELYFEDDPPPRNGTLLGGYAQSKWIAESIVRHARSEGLRAIIYRPGFVANELAMQDLASSIMKLVLRTRTVPDVDFSLDVISREYVAECFRSIWTNHNAVGHIFHINNPNPIALVAVEEFLRIQGVILRRVPFEEWLRGINQAVESSPDLASLELLRGLNAADLRMPILDCRNTLRLVGKSALRKLDRSVSAWLGGLALAE